MAYHYPDISMSTQQSATSLLENRISELVSLSNGLISAQQELMLPLEHSHTQTPVNNGQSPTDSTTRLLNTSKSLYTIAFQLELADKVLLHQFHEVNAQNSALET